MTHQNINRKKYLHHRISGLPENRHWCYSAKDLQKQLNQLLKGLVLKKLYIDLDSYIEAKHNRKYNGTCFDLSFVGGYTLLIFNKLAIEFVLHVEGMIEYSIISLEQIQFEEIYDYVPDIYDPVYAHLIELKDYFDAEYSEKHVTQVTVHHTDIWGFNLEGFDKEQADNAATNHDLPKEICFNLINGVQLRLICDYLEYFYIIIQKVQSLNKI